MMYAVTSVFLRVALILAGELPGLSERRECAQIICLVLFHQFAIHLFRRTDDVSPPLEGGGTSLRLIDQLGCAVARRVIAREQDCRLSLSGY